MNIVMPNDVKVIIEKLTENGYEAYAVGGCVRDSIIRRVPGDWDITTSATPMEVKALFRRTIDTGIAHGTVTIMMGHNGYEVTTYRLDGEYEDGRHPKSVEFTSSLREDLRRRDFTINAMAYNDSLGMVDMFGGMEDLKKGVIRCVGNAIDRFTEDALRMLRAVRFSAQLGFEIEENTCNAIRTLATNLSKISQERIHTELAKLLLSKHPDYIRKAYELGITKIVLPEYDIIEDKEMVERFLKELPEVISYKYGAILMHLESPQAVKTLKRLKLDNDTIDKMGKLVKYHKMVMPDNEIITRKILSVTGKECFRDVLIFEKKYYEINGEYEDVAKVEKAMELVETVVSRGDCYSIKDLAINGQDLIKAGVKPGKELGEILKRCLEDVIAEPKLNNYDDLMKKSFSYLH